MRISTRLWIYILTAALAYPLIACNPKPKPKPEPSGASGLVVMVTGVSGGALELQNLATGEALTVLADGTHEFAQPSDDYDVVVSSAPAGLTCVVDKGRRLAGGGPAPGEEARARCASDSADFDGDGLSDAEELVAGTDPAVADTDGDGTDDGTELLVLHQPNNNFRWNPRIADTPLLEVALNTEESNPAVTVEFEYQISSTSGETESFGYAQGNEHTRVNTWGGGSSRTVALGHTVSASASTTIGADVELGLLPTVTASFAATLETGLETSVSTTRGTTLNWENEAQLANSELYEEHVSRSLEEETTVTGALLTVRVAVRNPGYIDYAVSGLGLRAYLYDPEFPHSGSTIANLVRTGGIPDTSLQVNQQVIWEFSAPLTIDEAERLLRDSRSIAVEPSAGQLLCDDGTAIDLTSDTIAARTATVLIDFGADSGGRQDTWQVATVNGDGSHFISAADAIEQVLALEHEQRPGTWQYEDGVESQSPFGLAQLGFFDSADNYTMDSNDNRYWLVAHTRTTSGGGGRTTDLHHLLVDEYNLWDVKLFAGDVLSLVVVTDRDRDGLDDRLESELGTLPTLRDSDFDTLDDALEVYGFALEGCEEGAAPVIVRTDPNEADTDGDGLSDAAERADCSHPGSRLLVSAGADRGPLALTGSTSFSASIAGLAELAGPPVCTWRVFDPGFEAGVSDPLGPVANGCDAFVYLASDYGVGSFDVELTVMADDGAGMAEGTDTVRVEVQRDPGLSVYIDRDTSLTAAQRTGTKAAPYRNLGEALADAPGSDLYVMTRGTPYTVSGPLDVGGVSLFGGYDENWVRMPSMLKTPLVISADGAGLQFTGVDAETWLSGFALTSNGGSGDNVVAVEVAGNGGEFFLVDNTITAGNATGANKSSYGVYASNLSTFFSTGNIVSAGSGGPGSPGANGANGAPGANGDNTLGYLGGYGGSGGGSGAGRGGNGGSGSWTSVNGSDHGYWGQTGVACDVAGGPLGDPGRWNARLNGLAGGNGLNGANGTSHTAPDVFAFDPGKGADGQCGGGGGGGGGGAKFFGVHGGGGGGGGGGGKGGRGGNAGGLSAGMAVTDVVTFESIDDRIASAGGGSGGGAGARGVGRTGGTRGTGHVVFSLDNHGGNGGNGGLGGHGVGGPGGDSYALVLSSSVDNAYVDDGRLTAGVGGVGGSSQGVGGVGGDSHAIVSATLVEVCGVELVLGTTGTPGPGGVRAGAGGNGGGAAPGTQLMDCI